ncbi:DNRLRE domain-containing protein [Brevibacillus fulvus]|uniref:Carbohydrate-binding module family 96 domain-containing protein n=1 Tax=Brevibacillus fulvus TaxID=1125967 RepID=A0A938Y642_9BACL|nr:DNRLRE domain-containing protein [Brevibacillus fulvus]MBM7592242.1 hypothetical protein [Brevibacillus fulvus]
MPVVTLNRSNSVIQDTYIDQANPAANNSSSYTLVVGKSATANSVKRALIQFDFGLIPNDVIINSATLKLYQNTSGTTPMTIHPITSSWVGASTTWNTPPTFDVSSAVSFSGLGAAGVLSIDVTSLIQRWINGEILNNGFLIKANDETAVNAIEFASCENGVTANRPTLTIDYTIPTTGKKQVEVVGSGAVKTASAASSISPSLPANIQVGDLLVAHIVATSWSTAISVPSGWTKHIEFGDGGLNRRICVASKKVVAGETAPTFTGPSNESYGAIISAFRNVKGVVKTSYKTFASSVTAVYPSDSPVTTTAEKTMFLLLSQFSSTGNATPPLSYNELYDVNASTSVTNSLEASYHYMYSDKDQSIAEMTTSAGSSGYAASALLVLEPIVNNPPTLTLTSPADNQTLSEGNNYPVEGSATDTDSNSTVIIKCQINNGPIRNIGSGVSDGITPIPFSRTLVYRNKRIWDGTTDIVGSDLAENVDHTLKVWAEDDQGGKSPEQTIKFRVLHNKPPLLMVDAFTPVQSGLIPPDLITFSGEVSDPNGNTVTVTGQVNDLNPVTLLQGVTEGSWNFFFPVNLLKEGNNTVTIKATDQFGSFSVKNYNINTAVTKTLLTKGVARYKIIPPLGTAKEILAWLQREIGDLSVEGAASFVDAGQPETYTTLAKTSVDLANGVAEDELIGSVVDPKPNIVFKQTFIRANPESTEGAVQLVGVIE